MESMAGFIHEVVPQVVPKKYFSLYLKSKNFFEIQAYGGCHPAGEASDPILWAKIEQMDGGLCHSQSSTLHKTNLPLLLILGFSTGVQVMDISSMQL